MKNNYIISIPMDLKQIQSKLFLGLTKRQLIGFSIGLVVGVLMFLMLKNISLESGMYGLFFTVAPILFATMYKRNNMYIEQWIKIYIEQNYLNPQKRYYKVSKKNLKIAKERGIINERQLQSKRKRQVNTKTKSVSNSTTVSKQK